MRRPPAVAVPGTPLGDRAMAHHQNGIVVDDSGQRGAIAKVMQFLNTSWIMACKILSKILNRSIKTTNFNIYIYILSYIFIFVFGKSV